MDFQIFHTILPPIVEILNWYMFPENWVYAITIPYPNFYILCLLFLKSYNMIYK